MSDNLASAQRDADRVLRAMLAPAGFTGTRFRYYRRTEDAWHVIQIERMSTRSPDLAGISLTANLEVASYRLMAAQGVLAERRPPRGASHREMRIGGFMPGTHDRWWWIPLDATPASAKAVVEDLGRALLDYGLEVLNRYGTDVRLRDTWAAEVKWLSPPEEEWLMDLIRAIGPPSGSLQPSSSI